MKKVVKSELVENDFQHFIEEVVKFNTIAGNCVTNEALIPTYAKLVLEEGLELKTAKRSVDKLDAIVDSIFVAFYHNMLLSGTAELDVTMDPACQWTCYAEAEQSFLDTLEKGNNPCGDLIDICYNSEDTFNIRWAFDEVMRSNMSKFSVKKDIDVNKEIEYISTHSRYADVYAQEVEFEGETYIAFRALQDVRDSVTFDMPGKIVKPSSFSEPELDKFVY